MASDVQDYFDENIWVRCRAYYQRQTCNQSCGFPELLAGAYDTIQYLQIQYRTFNFFGRSAQAYCLFVTVKMTCHLMCTNGLPCSLPCIVTDLSLCHYSMCEFFKPRSAFLMQKSCLIVHFIHSYTMLYNIVGVKDSTYYVIQLTNITHCLITVTKSS